jgi:hypothetical protein
MGSINLTRQELYNLVWIESMLALSKKYDISDVAKIVTIAMTVSARALAIPRTFVPPIISFHREKVIARANQMD